MPDLTREIGPRLYGPARHHRGRWSCLLAVCLACLVAGCEKPEAVKASAAPPVPVEVAEAKRGDVDISVAAIGTVEVARQVVIRPRATGPILRVHFREGQFVKQGDLLFEIEERPYRNALDRAKAIRARSEAQLATARNQYSRMESLVRARSASAEELETIRGTVKALEATLQADDAEILTAEIQLGYCKIYSPLSGRTGAILVDAGNLVEADQPNPLVTINQIDPILVRFTLPQRYLQQIMGNQDSVPLPVSVRTSDGNAEIAGQLTFWDNAVDETTGTVELRATFANDRQRLWPGQFVDVGLRLARLEQVITIPPTAVQQGQAGLFSFVVRGEKVDMVPLRIREDVSQAVIVEDGLDPGDLVVTSGQIRLIPGTKVVIKTPDAGRPVPPNSAADGSVKPPSTAGETPSASANQPLSQAKQPSETATTETLPGEPARS